MINKAGKQTSHDFQEHIRVALTASCGHCIVGFKLNTMRYDLSLTLCGMIIYTVLLPPPLPLPLPLSLSPSPPPPLSLSLSLTQVALGQSFTIAISEDMTRVFGCGKADHGVFGQRIISGDHHILFVSQQQTASIKLHASNCMRQTACVKLHASNCMRQTACVKRHAHAYT